MPNLEKAALTRNVTCLVIFPKHLQCIFVPRELPCEKMNGDQRAMEFIGAAR